MAIKKTIELAGTGALAEYHALLSAQVNGSGDVTVAVASYVTVEAFEAGKSPVELLRHPIVIRGIPADGEGPMKFAESMLAAPAPPGAADLPLNEQPFPNRYLFAGGAIVE